MTSVSATFEADLDPAGLVLPDGVELLAPHRLTVTFGYFREIEWLAGRGYNVFGLYVPARATQNGRSVVGDLNLVLWENMADPIITGREDLGIAKLYCELPEPRWLGDKVISAASWDGFEFARLTMDRVGEGSPPDADAPQSSGGLLHYKYMPKTGDWGQADCAYLVETPAAAPNNTVISQRFAPDATVEFSEGSWDTLPTLFHITAKCARFDIGDCLTASVTISRGYKDLRDQKPV